MTGEYPDPYPEELGIIVEDIVKVLTILEEACRDFEAGRLSAEEFISRVKGAIEILRDVYVSLSY